MNRIKYSLRFGMMAVVSLIANGCADIDDDHDDHDHHARTSTTTTTVEEHRVTPATTTQETVVHY
jgi:hypothetical protein